jgi:hypothetical protein
MAGLLSIEEINSVQFVCVTNAAVEEGRGVEVLKFGKRLGGWLRLFGIFSRRKR